MENKGIKVESSAMLIGAIVNFMMAAAGIYMYMITDMVALFLDGSFSFVSGISCLMAILISKYSKKETRTFPKGLYFLEPLYGVLKSLIVITVTVSAFVSSIQKMIQYYVYGVAVPMNTGYMLYYMIAMVVLCLSLYVIFKGFNKRIENTSTMLMVESKAALVDTFLSLAIGIVVIAIMYIPLDSMFGFMHYIGDSILTLLLVLLTIKEPIIAFKESFIELVSGSETSLIDQTVQSVVNQINGDHDHYQIGNITTIKTGKKISAIVHLDIEDTMLEYAHIEAFKKEIMEQLEKTYPMVCVTVTI